MQVIIMSSCFTSVEFVGEEKFSRVIDNENGFLDTLKKYLTKRDVMVIISGSPEKEHHNPTKIMSESFLMSGLPFKKYIYVDSTNKENIDEYLKEADCVNLFGGHLFEANQFVNELNLKQRLKNFDGVILGASAGAMNLAEKVYAKPENENDFLIEFQKDLSGIGLTDINIIPHYNLLKNRVINNVSILNDIVIPDSKYYEFVLLPDFSYIVQKNGNKEMFGDIFKLKNCEITKIN